MLSLSQLLVEADRLAPGEQWQLVKHILEQLEHQQFLTQSTDEYQQFLLRTYGSLRDAPLERGDQGEYEVRDSRD